MFHYYEEIASFWTFVYSKVRICGKTNF